MTENTGPSPADLERFLREELGVHRIVVDNNVVIWNDGPSPAVVVAALNTAGLFDGDFYRTDDAFEAGDQARLMWHVNTDAIALLVLRTDTPVEANLLGEADMPAGKAAPRTPLEQTALRLLLDRITEESDLEDLECDGPVSVLCAVQDAVTEFGGRQALLDAAGLLLR
jgi:hypothetical protein